MDKYASLAEITDELKTLVKHGAGTANLESCEAILSLREVTERSPSDSSSDLAETSRVVLLEAIARIGGGEASALRCLLALASGTRGLGPGERKKRAADKIVGSYDQMRKDTWEKLIGLLAEQVHKDDFTVRTGGILAPPASTTGPFDTPAIRRRVVKACAALDEIVSLSVRCRDNLLGPSPNIAEKVELAIELSWYWLRLDKATRRIKKEGSQYDSLSPDLEELLESFDRLMARFPLGVMDQSMLRVTHRNSRKEIYTFTQMLKSDAIGLAVIDGAWSTWFACPMADGDECNCDYHTWKSGGKRILGIVEPEPQSGIEPAAGQGVRSV